MMQTRLNIFVEKNAGVGDGWGVTIVLVMHVQYENFWTSEIDFRLGVGVMSLCFDLECSCVVSILVASSSSAYTSTYM
jgi:hypothetical protein